MKITCPSCDTKFVIDLDQLGSKGRKLKCSSCTHVWREFDPEPQDTPPPEDKAPKTDEAPEAQPDEENDQSAIDDMFAPAVADDANEENDQGAIDDMFATEVADDANEENDQSAIDDMFATEVADDANEENDQGAIDDMFATEVADDANEENEENDQGAIDDMFATEVADDANEENDQNSIDDMFAIDSDDADEENDQNSIDDMFASSSATDDDMNQSPQKVAPKALKTTPKASQETNEAEFEKALPSQSAIYKKPKKTINKTSYIYWGGLAVAASLILGIFVIGKDMIINYFPKSAASYELYGFETNVIGLEFVNINVRHQNQDGIDFLLINGSIMNNSDSTKTLPKVRGYLVDRNGNNIFNWPIEIAKTSLAAGEIVSFKSGMKDPAPQAQQVKFQFIIDKQLAGK